MKNSKLKIAGIVIGILFLLWVIGSVGGNNPKGTSTSSQEQAAAPPKPPKEIAIKINASDLYNEYNKNAIAADDKYKDKLLEVSGKVSTIDKDILGSIYVAVKTNDLIGVVQCMLDDSEKEKAAKLSKDQKVTVTGKNSGKTLTNIILEECKIN